MTAAAAVPGLLAEAERWLAERDLDRAAELFHRAAGLGPPGPAAIGLARIALLLDRPTDAARLLDEVLAQAPRHGQALMLRGLVEETRGQLDDALTWLARALAVEPTSALAWFNQGRLFAQLRQWDVAAASFTLALQHGALEPEAHVQLGVALFRAGRVGPALKAVTEAVQRFPEHLDATLTLADLLVETGRLDLADALLLEAQARFPAAGALPSRRAVVALQRKDLELARLEAWRHTELSPRDEEAWLFAAVVDTMLLRFDTAERALRQALRLNPGQWRAHYHLGGLADALRDVAGARAAYRAAIALNPCAWEPLNNLATGLLEEGTPASLTEARALLERAARLQRGAEGVLARYNLVLACWRLGDLAAARAAGRELCAFAPPEHPLAGEARRLLRLAA